MKKVNISQVDALFANGIYPIEFLFYYKEGLDTKNFRNALKKLSSVFWPIFGEYKDGRIRFETYKEDDLLEFETVDQDFPLPPDEKERLDVYSPFRLSETKKLFRSKIMQFKNGMLLVARMSHLAGDGYSYFYFLSALAALSQRSGLPSRSSLMRLFFKPHHRRTILKDFAFRGIKGEAPRQETQFTTGIAEVPRKDVNVSIRRIAEAENFRVSTNDILSAMAVKKLAGIPKKIEGESIGLTIPIDVRRRVREFGRRFFGNGIWLYRMELKREDIDKMPVEELAVQIRRSMPSVSKQTYTEYLSRLEEIISEGDPKKFRPFDPESGYLVTNISRLPVDRLNFGTDLPGMIYPLTIERSAAAVLAKGENFILRYAT